MLLFACNSIHIIQITSDISPNYWGFFYNQWDYYTRKIFTNMSISFFSYKLFYFLKEEFLQIQQVTDEDFNLSTPQYKSERPSNSKCKGKDKVFLLNKRMKRKKNFNTYLTQHKVKLCISLFHFVSLQQTEVGSTQQMVLQKYKKHHIKNYQTHDFKESCQKHHIKNDSCKSRLNPTNGSKKIQYQKYRIKNYSDKWSIKANFCFSAKMFIQRGQMLPD